MKKLLIACIIAAVIVGCGTARQTAFKTFATIQQVTTKAFDIYLDQVVTKTIPNTSLDQVSKKYNKFQVSYVVALDVVEFNTNVLAPSSLVIESQDLINLISTFTKK